MKRQFLILFMPVLLTAYFSIAFRGAEPSRPAPVGTSASVADRKTTDTTNSISRYHGISSISTGYISQKAPVTAVFSVPGRNEKRSAAKLVALCKALKATLSAEQAAALQLAYTFSNIRTWSNLPAAMSPRVGIRLGSLNAVQLAAAKAIIQEMSGATANEGWQEVQQIWAADDYLAANGGGPDYGSGNYYLAFFGTPSGSGTYEIMMTGHHATAANTYTNGALVAATPHFSAVEPLSFPAGAVTYTPIDQEKDAFAAILKSFSETQLNTARSGSTFSDLLLGPRGNWQFPGTKSGLPCSQLTAAQKTLVTKALKTYVYDVDDADAAAIMARYSSALDSTYIMFSGTTSMNTQNDYFRLDGPRVWIEFSVQHGIVFRGVHYHSVWRDKVTDYAGTHE